jgi:hypothetical protein
MTKGPQYSFLLALAWTGGRETADQMVRKAAIRQNPTAP